MDLAGDYFFILHITASPSTTGVATLCCPVRQFRGLICSPHFASQSWERTMSTASYCRLVRRCSRQFCTSETVRRCSRRKSRRPTWYVLVCWEIVFSRQTTCVLLWWMCPPQAVVRNAINDYVCDYMSLIISRQWCQVLRWACLYVCLSVCLSTRVSKKRRVQTSPNFYFARGSGCEVLWWMCLSVSLSARISPEPHARCLPIFVHVAYVRGSVLRLLTIGRIAYRREGGDESAQRGRSVIYDCLVCTCYLWSWLGSHLTTMQYVMYFRFCGWRHVCP